ncbi:hypothetical protein BGZ96_011005 [Linnemannia gamsii]|uniref:F-box domain-containing protein n=1 Tax=Linnemannia gamsii TaxID=64522 RepID=A0ABQ7KC85_9FUNG|nr:hypothetical protein BGZ96_011005 [Linnemannia gamsii]
MPASATEQFFEINELVMQLGPCLDQNTLAKLMRTSKHLYEIFKPFFFFELDFFDEPSRDFRLLRKTTPIETLRMAVVHVRVLATGPLFTGYYYQCLRKYQEEINTKGAFATYTPAWIPPLDLSNSSIVSLTPLVNLTEFNCYSQLGSFDTRHRCSVKGIRQGAVRLAQALWILKCCPALTHLGLEVFVTTQQDVLVLASVISKIPRLKRLELSMQRTESLFPTLGSTLFFKAPASLDELGLHYDDFADEDISDNDDYFDNEQDLGDTTHLEGESVCEGEQQRGPTSALTYAELQDVLTRRQEPLSNLIKLKIQAIRYTTFTDVLSIFDHCPNITSLCIPDLAEHIDIDEVGRHIAKVCPKLHTISHTNVGSNGRLVMSIMGAMPEQQLEGLSYIQLDKDSATTAALILRHSTSLRTIRFDQCCHFDSKAIQSILVECQGLEVLTFNYSVQKSISLDLEDAVEFKWGATRLKTLCLVVAIGDLGSLQGEDPYYKRPAPITFSDKEAIQMSTLGRLYSQLGELLQLKQLEIAALVKHVPQVIIPNTPAFKYATFPGFLSLGDPLTRRPGFLHHLGGLRKLEELKGSVHGGTEETVVTMGQREVEWIVQNLISLKRVDFCCRHPMVDKETRNFPWFQWLKRQKPNLVMTSEIWQ